ncbi:MAG: hypothetical protein E6Q92_12585 [Burkholderiaceae bacterium]|nr:MAG: hypothetical protein E6Q92_12585 [Burkholderiaceae bacterium]
MKSPTPVFLHLPRKALADVAACWPFFSFFDRAGLTTGASQDALPGIEPHPMWQYIRKPCQ